MPNKEIAAAAGIDAGYLSNLKQGKRAKPSAPVTRSLASALSVPYDWLATGAGSPRLTVKEDPATYGGVAPFMELSEPSLGIPPSRAELNIVMVEAVLGLLDAAFDKIEAGELPESTLKTARQMMDIVKAQWPGAAKAFKESKP